MTVIKFSIQNLIHFCRHLVLNFSTHIWINRMKCLEALFSNFLRRIHEPIAYAIEASVYGDRADIVAAIEYKRHKSHKSISGFEGEELYFSYANFVCHGSSLLPPVALPNGQKSRRTGSRAGLPCATLRHH